MRTPSEFELQHILGAIYDPVKAHEYYEKHKKLKGRKKGSAQPRPNRNAGTGKIPTGFAKSNAKRHESAKAKQKKELAARIQSLSKKLNELEALIRKKEHEEKADNRKSKAKKERAAKEKDKPKTAAEKAKAARENEKYRDKHKQGLKNKAKKAASKSGGSSSSKNKPAAKASVSELKVLATKVKGQIAVAKQKLAAL
jgi:hypothetical protein